MESGAKRYPRTDACPDVARPAEDVRSRFRENDAYRVRREWLRLEGTHQRDLFRELRRRFLQRHAGPPGWALDAGSGPGRFTAEVGPPGAHRIAVDIGRESLFQLAELWPAPPVGPPLPDRVRADLVHPPFAREKAGTVVALGNLLGFAGEESDDLVGELTSLVAPGGSLVLEVAPGPGERSRYLTRLPGSAVSRLLRAPVRALIPRIAREGFAPIPARRRERREFRRFDPAELSPSLLAAGFVVDEVLAVAPALGPDPGRIEAIAADPFSWRHLIEVEELIGRLPARWPHAAAVLLAARRKSEA